MLHRHKRTLYVQVIVRRGERCWSTNFQTIIHSRQFTIKNIVSFSLYLSARLILKYTYLHVEFVDRSRLAM